MAKVTQVIEAHGFETVEEMCAYNTAGEVIEWLNDMAAMDYACCVVKHSNTKIALSGEDFAYFIEGTENIIAEISDILVKDWDFEIEEAE